MTLSAPQRVAWKAIQGNLTRRRKGAIVFFHELFYLLILRSCVGFQNVKSSMAL